MRQIINSLNYETHLAPPLLSQGGVGGGNYDSGITPPVSSPCSRGGGILIS